MAKVQRSEPGKMPPRSESFLRMLELEKQYKMQRIQDSPPTTASLPSPTSASAQPSSAPRARRGSGYPPLSHQDQMMKAMNRSSALPSLSVSIPPSPEQDPPSKSSDPREEPHPAKEERTKTVTFSNPGEDESDLSDQSSICHSPSWEGWSKKTKRPNKPEPREQQRNKEEKPGKTLKKKGNKLSKAPPQSPLAVSAVRSQSASELDPHHKPDRAVINASQPVKQETMAQGQVNQKRSSLQGDDKSKSRKFLSGFKLQHGNVTGGKKSAEISQKGAETTQSGRNRSSSVLSFNKSHSAGPGSDMGSMGSHKPSAESSNRSYSSIEKRPPMVRPPSSSSSHGRSQSLLSSTLNKLRGPSYLYHRPQEERGSNSSVRPASRDNASLQPPGRSDDRLSSSGEPTPVATKSSFPRRFRHKATASDTVVSLGQPDTSRPLVPRDLGKGHDSPEPRQFFDRRGHRPSTQTSDSKSTMRDSQEHIQQVSESQGNLHKQDDLRGRHLDSHNTKAQSRSTESERRHNTNGQVAYQIQQPAENIDNVDQESVASSQDEDYASAYEHQSDHASGTAQRRGGESRAGAKTSMPAARTSSRERDNSPMTTSRRVEPSPMPSTLGPIGRTVTSDSDADSKAAKSGRSSKQERSELQNEGNTQIPAQQIRANKSTDYFTFINESYAPPSLELRSPLENLLQSLSKSERFEKVEIADTLRTRPSSRQLAESERPSSSETQTISSRRKTGDKLVNGHKSQDSPAIRPQISEHDAPSVERLGASAKPAKTFPGSDAGSTSTKRSQQHEANHSASERSSSSTFGDSPPSPSSMATPDSSRPHSHTGRPPSHLDLSRNGLVVSNSASDEKSKSRRFPLSSRDRSTSSSRPSSKETDSQADNWSRSTLPIDLENYSSITLGGLEGLASSPALVSTPTSMTFADALKEEIAEELNSKSHSALDLSSTNLLPPLKHQFLNPKKNTSKLSVSATSAPDSPLSEPVDEPLKPALKKARNTSSNGQEAPVLVSSGAAYLQEARKTVSNAPVPVPRMLRPQFAHRNTAIGTKGTTASNRTEPMAKMLVECCSCHFFHDMPARVYECMAKPDSFVEDKTLGVSAAITTMVKCPWCGHGMTTQCCSGYAAVVYLKEKLHGK